jgi:geranylgeranyl diphosphate synthase type II
MLNYQELYDKVNLYIENMPYNAQPEGLYAPIKYVLELGGKRIRPVLMLMAYNLYKDNVDDILPNSIALETYHNFTLLHDDLMDRADMRRGHLTVHKKWNDNTAILSGDAMLIMAYKLFTETTNPQMMKAVKTFNAATLGVCDGQQYDVEFESRNDVREEEYMEMIRLKTSLLLACALKIGAELAGASPEDADSLYQFGEKMGLAFQLQDDLLDVYGDPAVFGKQIGGDILCNKKTFMLINAFNRANPTQKAQLQEWVDKTDFVPAEKIQAVTALYDAVGIKALCLDKIEQLFSQSLECLAKVKVEESKKTELKAFADKLLKRNK